MSGKVNTSETILTINETNDKKQNLGNAKRTLVTNAQEQFNGTKSNAYSESDTFEKLGPENYTDELKEYEETPDSYKDSVLNKYDNENHVVNQPVQSRPSHFVADITENKVQQELPKYESMYKDKTCAFFLGSISLLSLYVIYKFIERD